MVLNLTEPILAFVLSPERERPGELQSPIIATQSSKRDLRLILSLTDIDYSVLLC